MKEKEGGMRGESRVWGAWGARLRGRVADAWPHAPKQGTLGCQGPLEPAGLAEGLGE